MSPQTLLWSILGLSGCGLFNAEPTFREHDYTSMEGYESFTMRSAERGDNNTNVLLGCDVKWTMSGIPLSIPETCVDCEFLFLARLERVGSYVINDANCGGLASDSRESLAYVYGYDPMSGYLIMSYNNEYIEWAPATFEDGTLTYGFGFTEVDLTDYGYTGYSFTYYWYGQATIQ